MGQYRNLNKVMAGSHLLKNRLILKNKTSKIILFLAVIILPFGLLAQNAVKTAYEKRIEQIYKEAAQKLGYSDMNILVEVDLLQGFEDYVSGKDTKKARVFAWAMAEEKAANKLKTEVDFKREKAEEAQRLAQKSAREKELEFKETDDYKIKKILKTEFNEWQEKGEFEKTTDYEERLKNNSIQQFYQICSDVLKEYVSRFDEEYLSNRRVEGTLQPYNTDLEYFPVKFRFLSTDYTVPVQVAFADAPKFKDKYIDNWKVNFYDYVFVNNYLIPSKVIYAETNKPPRIFTVPVKNSKEVSFSFNDLGIQNQYCKNAVFHISMIKTMEEEQKRLAEEQAKEQKRLAEEQARERMILDSLEFKKYNQILECIVQAYNQKLLQNEYNFSKQQIELESIRHDGDYKNKFASAIRSTEMQYNKILAQTEQYKKSIEDFKNQTNLVNYVYRSCGSAGRASDSPTYFRIEAPFSTTKGVDEERIILREKLIEIAVDMNKQLNKEWIKNGQYFDSKTDFYESFISSNCMGHANTSLNENYKNILKQKQSKKK